MLSRSLAPAVAVAAFVSCLVCIPARAGDVYVSPTGVDTQPGTADAPIKSLRAAADAVRKLRAAQPDRKEPIVVTVAAGRYELREPITLDAADAGTADSPTIYRAAEGATPIFSGGRVITGWAIGDDGLWRTTIEDVKAGRWNFIELFVDGRRRTRARFPDGDYLHVDTIGEDKRTNFTWNEGDIPFAKLHGEAELVFLHDWSISRIRIASIDPATRRLTTAFPVGCNARHYAMDWFEKHPRYFLENDPAFIDQPGEWHLDRATGVLTYKPAEGETPDKTAVIAPVAEHLLIVAGSPDNPVRHVRFEGLTFEHCAWLPPSGGYAEGQAAFHEDRDGGKPGGLRQFMNAAVDVSFAEDVRLTGCTVTRVGGTGVWVGERTRACVIERCRVVDTAGNGVMLGEGKRLPPDQTATGNVLRDSVVERAGQRYYGAVGVWAGIVRDHVIEHNTIAHHPYTGVSIGWVWNPTPTSAAGNQIRHNHIHHVMQILSDGGGIYSLGRQPGSKLIGNVIHDVPLNAGRAESNGMFLDEGTADVVISDNVIYRIARSPLRFHRADKNLVKDNTLVVGESTPPVRYNNTPEANITLENNRVVPEAEFKPADSPGDAGPRPGR